MTPWGGGGRGGKGGGEGARERAGRPRRAAAPGKTVSLLLNCGGAAAASCRLNCQFVAILAALAGLPLNLQSQGAVHKLNLISKMPVRDTAGPVGLFSASCGIHGGYPRRPYFSARDLPM
jgi:hypothetical protein